MAPVLLEPLGLSSEEAEWRDCSHTTEDESPDESVHENLLLNGTPGFLTDRLLFTSKLEQSC